ncbi:transcriptional regulator family: Fungal Specific TF [Paecilomyces variotii]|nr:transcriptional regulator family: Fungal Specific TF [Paecilomyces variotii]KAJ9277697.1 transcriptional regulator family: Fungal Specific TF [Paecilomyces variotii]KAJ9338408.1 transcriptional regulator family: Fungal Specific TF [Paecilomyces variotii]KAJ9354252.1 transcriptional regulator family: Fungal Specific TF [Paecilomyces variotii]KAJ9389343.1 transcriptional regulator family: Fungal Specific TF [Paecilomyces variotii]
MSRPQVSIDRLAPRRVMSEPREAMNCKSCRKRKIKCNRLRPSCEACKVFQCPCIYDATPKKRGPKTDVLEALLKRVDGLEKRLQEERTPASPVSPVKATADEHSPHDNQSTVNPGATGFASTEVQRSLSISRIETNLSPHRTSMDGGYGASFAPTQERPPHLQSQQLPHTVLDTFFSRIHGKPYYILDEADTRQKHKLGQLPPPLSMAIHAITISYGEPSLRSGLEYAVQSKRAVDIDDPSVETLQTLILLSLSFFAHGLGKKAYMTLSNCITVAIALDLHREAPSKVNLSSSEREMRRRLFWTCYVLDKFAACGSKRPCLISDASIALRLPLWTAPEGGLHAEGEMFNTGPNIHYFSDPRRKTQGATTSLIDITRILGITHQYLVAGGVKGDSHFPWHSLSNLSKIRQELDIWAAGTQDVFSSVDALFGHPESTTLLLSKLIYHLVHCLIYRPFLPIDLLELRGTGQHQSWQIGATNLCFSHSNAIAELVDLGRKSPLIEWPAFVGYCVCTAATVHVHGVHYKGQEGEVFSSSAGFLAREMQQLSWLRNIWAGVQHQRELLQNIYTCHAELVRTLATSPMRFSPVFHLEDFFDRYPGLAVEGSHIRLTDSVAEFRESVPLHSLDAHNLYLSQIGMTSSRLSQVPYQMQGQNSAIRSSTLSSLGQRDMQQLPKDLIPTTPSSATNPQLSFLQNPQQTSHASISTADANAFPVLEELSSTQNLFTPSTFGLSPPGSLSDTLLHIAATPPSNPQYATFPFDAVRREPAHGPDGVSTSMTALTPGAISQASGSHATAASENGSSEKDPFLSLLEQLAENEQNSLGGPSELDFFLGAVEGSNDVLPSPGGDSGRNDDNAMHTEEDTEAV